jgi:hypothetical protein
MVSRFGGADGGRARRDEETGIGIGIGEWGRIKSVNEAWTGAGWACGMETGEWADD